MEDAVVASIRHVIQDGIYSPLTSSGKLVVDGLLCSCYAVSKAKEYDRVYALFGEHQLLHAATFPIRMLREREQARKRKKPNFIGMDPIAALFWNPNKVKLRDQFAHTGWL